MANPKFKIFVGTNSQFYFHLIAGNGEIILSSEGYTTQSNCTNGINSVKLNSTDGNLYQEKVATNGKPYFVLHAKNGEVIGKSQMYDSRHAMRNGVMSVMNTAPGAVIEN